MGTHAQALSTKSLVQHDFRTGICFGVLSSKILYLVVRRWERREGLRLASLAVGGC
jgi:hypothetical protein